MPAEHSQIRLAPRAGPRFDLPIRTLVKGEGAFDATMIDSVRNVGGIRSLGLFTPSKGI
ncbi:hypothetical protein ACFSC3_01020 [Sphingomonas floccifaciens]|uniref:Uncharacterized protein n=1 Tax=Sphingomonas floccifaciens TaxID=1844115 RepID=A0ABW4N8V9_9SPHN